VTVDVQEKLGLRDRLLSKLEQAMRVRSKRQRYVPDGHGRTEPGWVAFERTVMAAAVEAERRARGLLDASAERLRRAERLAVGHTDYAEKFALYCAEIVLDEDGALTP
jgi:hypothetical protein